MIDELRAIAVFAEVVQQGSFRAAARRLGLSPSVVSYHLSQLEQRVGTALVYRSTRQLSLSHEGEILYQHARQMMGAAEQGLSQLSGDAAEPVGRLTVSMPAAMGRAPMNAHIADFCNAFPAINLLVSFTDRRQDLISEGIDLAIRAGDMEDSAFKSRRLGQIERRLVCSPGLYESQPGPARPADLSSWQWIRLAMLPENRIFVDAAGRRRKVDFEGRIEVDNVEAMTEFARLGLGLATPPAYLVDEALADGSLREVLPAWRVTPIPLYAVWHRNAMANSNTRRLLNFLVEAMT